MDVDLNMVIVVMSWMMIVGGIGTFCALVFTPFKATYGRYYSESKLLKFAVPAKVAWFVQELPAFAVPVYLMLCGHCTYWSSAPNLVFTGLYVLHYFQRTFIFPFLIRGGKPTPIDNFLLAVLFCVYNGFLQGYGHCSYALYPSGYLWSLRSFFGINLFFVGMGINIHSDHILRNLRKPGETGYKIPQGGMFVFVSGANFLGEIVEWLGYAIAAGTLPAAAFALFTASNIGPRAIAHHKFYKEKFKNYPKERKALIPFVL